MRILAYILLSLVVLGSLSMSLAFPWFWGKNQPAVRQQVIDVQNATPLSEQEIEGLQYMREEEKLARDVYLALYEEWKDPVFERIAQSEEQHTSMVKQLLDAYGIPDPAKDEEGVFTNQELQALYTQLVERGRESLAEALRVGALIEETDIQDLNERLESVEHEDIRRVYTNLKAGSENHLRAFITRLEALNESYTPSVLSQEEVEAILNNTSPHGRQGMVRENARMMNQHEGVQGQGRMVQAMRGQGQPYQQAQEDNGENMTTPGVGKRQGFFQRLMRFFHFGWWR